MFANCNILDLSVPLAHQAKSEPFPAEIEYIDHHQGGRQMEGLFGVPSSELKYSDGGGWAIEHVKAITHTGTHVDAPYHYGPMSGGLPARRIDQVPLEWCFAPGVCLDMTHLTDGDEITISELKTALGKIDHKLEAREIVLLRTDADLRLEREDYLKQPGLGREGTLWLVEQGIRMIGIDAYTLDRPFHAMKAEYEETGDGNAIWPAHFAGITAEYCQIEKLANLHQLPTPTGFWVSCLPVKIEEASAGWCRAVALIPDTLQ
ncbi:MAG: cyclase [Planctomycetaceae bacterium]|nr:cyclase [Planctomycetaceae bacterium]|tara:strand:- start:411 stop:1196 length:786 start_codon:yes stop_codon:yes gene_type:complete